MSQSALRALLDLGRVFDLFGGGGKSATQTTLQSGEPPAYAAPHLARIAGEGETNYANPLSFFPGSTFAGFAPETEAAMTGQTVRSLMGAPIVNAAQGNLINTIGGGFLDSGNPAFAGMAKAIRDQVEPAVASQFGMANRVGSGGHQSEFERVFANAIAPLAFQNYENERGRQQTASLAAPGFSQNDYADLERLAAVGASREQQVQQAINEQIQRFQFGQQEPWQRLANYQAAVVPGLMGGRQTSTTTGKLPSSSPLLGSLGLGLGLLGMFGAMGPFGPAGALALGGG